MLLPVEQMYQQWLGGLSIRSLAKQQQVGRSSVWIALTRKYGKEACNLRKQSLARIVYQEYGDLELAYRAMGTEGLYRTTKTDNNYTQHQTTDLKKHQLVSPVATYSPRKAFNLKLYRFVTDSTTHLLYLTMWARVNRKSLGHAD